MITLVNASHPGSILKHDFLEPLGISQKEFAEHVGISQRSVNLICQGKRAVTADMAVRIAQALGGRPQFWLNLQANHELGRVFREDAEATAIERMPKSAA